MLRRTALMLAAILAATVVTGGAAAGGGAVFEFDRDYYVPGDRAVGETDFWVPRTDRHLLERAFYAYLIPRSGRIDPPSIPSDAVPLGPVALGGLARISFMVPEVRPGPYNVGICDRPCRHAYVGDLMGGWITVVGSREEARLRVVIDRLEGRLSEVHSDLARRLSGNQERTATLQGGLDVLTHEVSAFQEDVRARLARLEGQPETGGAEPFDRAGWIVAVLALAALAFVSVGRGRRPEDDLATGPPSRVVLDGQDLEWRTETAEVDERASVGTRGYLRCRELDHSAREQQADREEEQRRHEDHQPGGGSHDPLVQAQHGPLEGPV
jgi:hypothetical protein